jgi:protease-4
VSRRTIWGLVIAGVVLLSLVLLLVLGGRPAAGPPLPGGLRENRIAVLYLSGTIQSAGSTLLGVPGITPTQVRRLLKRAERDPSVKAIVLRIDSPGGAAAASQEIAGLIKRFEKPKVVSMGDIAASGGYYISTTADYIFANPATLTGSIGVIWTSFDIEGLLEKIGVKIETITSGKHKDMFLPGRLTPERREIIQEMTDQMYEQFVDAVAEGRKLERSRVLELATGQVYTGAQAKELGLVDELGGLEEAIKKAAQLAEVERYSVVEYAPSLWELLFGGWGGGLREALVARLLGNELYLLRSILGQYSVPWY